MFEMAVHVVIQQGCENPSSSGKFFQFYIKMAKTHTAVRDAIRNVDKMDILFSSLLNKRRPSCHFSLASRY